MSNSTLSANAALEQLQWRYATKKFDATQDISETDWTTLEQSLVLAPSSFGLQPWKFFVVKNPEIRSQLLPHSWNQPQIVDASHLVVFAIKKDIGDPGCLWYHCLNFIVRFFGIFEDRGSDYDSLA